MTERSVPGILVAAPKSGSGKTLVTAALLAALRRRGLSVQAFKAGPDFIDPMYHRAVLDRPSYNLDTWLAGRECAASLFAAHCRERKTDLAVIEGVMGLYDGAGGTEEAGSSYDLAAALSCPVLLVIDAEGMGRSILAETAGFLTMDRSHLIRGVLLNRVSGAYAKTLSDLIEKTLHVPVVGCFPKDPALHLASRHLGLMRPEESGLKGMLSRAADALEANADIGKILSIAASRDAEDAGQVPVPEKGEPFRVALARDPAFCFVYEDNLNLLTSLGAEIIPFSPMEDAGLPEHIQGLYLPGGYPELYARELAGNISMREEIRRALSRGLPCIAECGGFLYLQRTMEDREGRAWPMAGYLAGNGRYAGHPVRFGYLTLQEKTPCFLPEGTGIRGHEFHYYDTDDNGSSCRAEKPVRHRGWDCIKENGNQFLGFPHLYWPSCPAFAEHFAAVCRAYKGETE